MGLRLSRGSPKETKDISLPLFSTPGGGQRSHSYTFSLPLIQQKQRASSAAVRGGLLINSSSSTRLRGTKKKYSKW